MMMLLLVGFLGARLLAWGKGVMVLGLIADECIVCRAQ